MNLPTLWSDQINSVFENQDIYGTNYIGCMSKDALKKMTPKNKFAVINNAIESKEGTHWTCFYACKNQPEICFFDSMGAPPATDIHVYLSKIARKTGKEIVCNPMQIQPMGTDSCGWFCIYVLSHLNAGYRFQDVLKQFSHIPSLNESALFKYFEKTITALEKVEH